MLKFIINENIVETEMHPGTVLLDFIREHLKLTGTKEACREGECGACTVLVGKIGNDGILSYKSCASCILPIGDVKNCHIVTVEGLNMGKPTAIQKAIIDASASQCGYCTPGIVLSLTGFCFTSDKFEYNDSIDALDGNICRCTGYVSIRNAAKFLSDFLKEKNTNRNKRLETLIDLSVVPEYFKKIPEMLKKMNSSASSERIIDKTIVAGGTDLFVQRPEELAESKLYFMSDRCDLNYIKIDDSNILVGGAVTIEDFRKSEITEKYFPSMKNDLLLHSSTILRNKATLAGNIVNASPIGDMTIILLALNAVLVLECENMSVREVELSNFYKGYKQIDLKKSEIIREIKIPVHKKQIYFNFEKVSNRKILDIASVNSAMFLTTGKKGVIEELKISAGGVAPVPYLVKELDKYYGKSINENIISKIVETVEKQVVPIDDIRGSAKYKSLLLKQLIKSHFKKQSNNAN
ncbi:FAD binding domain-containing protein [Candidatus Dependentiae bacterium]|nr:FAD binding domain-containing protein [Candidatus Dependentiae bacterium]